MVFTAMMISRNNIIRCFCETDDYLGAKRAVAFFCLGDACFKETEMLKRKAIVDKAFDIVLDLPKREITCDKVDLSSWLHLFQECSEHIPQEKRITMVLSILHSRFPNISTVEMLKEVSIVEKIGMDHTIRYGDDFPKKPWLKIVRDMSRLADKTANALREIGIEDSIENPLESIKTLGKQLQTEQRSGFLHFQVDEPHDEETFIATVAKTKTGKITLAVTPLYEFEGEDEFSEEILGRHLAKISRQLYPDVNSQYRYFSKYGFFCLISTICEEKCLEPAIKASVFELVETQDIVDAWIDDIELGDN